MSFGKRLRERRIELGMSQSELARLLGVTSAAVSNYESGQNAVREDVLLKMFRVLDIDPNYLYQDSLTGKSFNCSVEEKSLVLKYRSLSTVGRQALHSVVDALGSYQADMETLSAAVGIHPSDAQTECKLAPAEEIERLRSIIGDEQNRKEKKIVAIGEIGYDYYWQPVDRELQKYYFEAQMKLAGELALPVIIHDREAHADTFDMICAHPGVIGVLHSCSMSAEMVKEIVKRGWYVSFSGPLTYKNAQRVREACAAVPLDRLLVETDAPYLSPVPYRGKLNNSVYMRETVAEAATIHGVSFDEMARITAKNARDLFRI